MEIQTQNLLSLESNKYSYSAHRNVRWTLVCVPGEYPHVGVQLEVSGDVSQGEVVLGQLGLGRVERHLVAGQPALVAQNGRRVHDGTLEVDVATHVDKVALEGGLQLAALLPGRQKNSFGCRRKTKTTTMTQK